ncbi:MAG: acetyl-CoA C-acyltransferase [Hydrogenophaga sp.]|uniref:thiolase family protein n=1 Tax=Hydrogenophaga sp. TaxID=1904254 RepID=UPI0016B53A13|nr:thiolase family protein [Hydrogenophaga sp.]NIM42987.1 acetyl-CoA C-acyltransferase [Hydrogenophaga sp.]NIN27917.1 acetyl-CoA C-acyltransferase [Hydrogenophaga sp.]NIN32694.1 acetyl-CoA C-acyltransferase [Hydrogenophaga sp.]NIN57190.1 acetyl-CoA C-acyltransferase [Hydrogenophaga sp.]NIO53606.1 acetyl-CoA C-acyltransferase [Hydrogenophaga sp.]
MSRGQSQLFNDVFILDGVRTPMVDYQGAFADANPIDLGIKVAREVLKRTGVSPDSIDSVLAGNMAPGGFDQFYVPRHIGLYAGVPVEVPALMTQRICGTGFELFRQAGEQIGAGVAKNVLLVGTESMTRNPIAAFDHRGGFRLGAPIGFKDYMWEALTDPAADISMIRTAENLAQRYGIRREDVDAFASRSFERAVAAQAAGWFDGEIVPVGNETFEREGYRPRGIRLAGKATVADRDTHPRPTPPEVLAKLRTVFKDGVQTGGNSSALTDAAAAAVVTDAAGLEAFGKPALARLAAAAVVGVPPEIMGIGPAPAIRLLLERAGLALGDIARFEINEAQGAQTVAVARELGLDEDRLNVHGGAIALGHPLGATGVRLTITCARQLRDIGARWGIASACVGGGQGIALLIENTQA